MSKKARSALSLNSRWSLFSATVLFAAAALVAGSPANAVSYKYTQIDVPGATSTTASGINDAGQIVGNVDNDRAFIYFDGSFTKLVAPGAFLDQTAAWGINDAGQIVGSFLDSTPHRHGFLDTGGSFTQLDVPGAPNSASARWTGSELGAAASAQSAKPDSAGSPSQAEN